jgi:hypothetical protein
LQHAEQLSNWDEHWFAQPGTVFRHSLYQEAGGQVREDLHYAMDLDLWLRLIHKAPPGFIEAELAAYRLHAAAKTTVLTPACETEIVRVVAQHLGLEAALSRVAVIAQQKMVLEQKYRHMEAMAKPFLSIYSPLKRLAKAIGRREGGAS